VGDLDTELLNEFYSGPNLFTVTATLHEAQLTNQPTNSPTRLLIRSVICSLEISRGSEAVSFLATQEIPSIL
jgi:hypothetical protein